MEYRMHLDIMDIYGTNGQAIKKLLLDFKKWEWNEDLLRKSNYTFQYYKYLQLRQGLKVSDVLVKHTKKWYKICEDVKYVQI